MVKIISLAACALFLMHPANGTESLYFPCQSCHGGGGGGNEALGAPAIAGMDTEYFVSQMKSFRDGVRGDSLDDPGGRQMSLIAALLTDDEDIRTLAAYVANMQKVKPFKTIEILNDDVENVYAPCAICHGLNGEGVRLLNGPSIAWLDDWYIEQQLKNFKSGVRGSDPVDANGQQMKLAVASLPDEDVRKLASYITTLSGESATNWTP